MHRILFTAFGLLEFAVALVLAVLGRQLPDAADVAHSFENAERVTYRAGNQVRLFRQQVSTLRRPELQRLADRLQEQTRSVVALMKSRSIDYDTVRVMRDALGDVAQGLESLAETLDADRIGQLGKGLGETAAFLDLKVIPSSRAASQQLDDITKSLGADARRLQVLVRQAPLDLKAVAEVHDSLGRFGEGLERMQASLNPQRFKALHEGFTGLETSLATGAEQVERLAGYTYPVVKFTGLKASVERRQFWPEGDKIAGGMRKAAAGAEAAREELEAWAEDLPKLRASVAESAKVVQSTRDALGAALRQRDKIEPLLKDVPDHVGRLAESLPKFSDDLARILRDTRHLRDVAGALRQAEKGIDDAVARWPEIRKMLARSAVLLKSTRDQLDLTLEHRDEFDGQLQQTTTLAETFAALLPLFTAHLGEQLQEQEQGLDDLGDSIGEFGAAIPLYAQSVSDLLRTARWLIWLVAGTVALHGAYLTIRVKS
jgi:methyl-accepting chemotaxis protein